MKKKNGKQNKLLRVGSRKKRKITLNNVAFHNLKHSVSYNGTKIESNNVEIHVYTFSTCNIKPEED